MSKFVMLGEVLLRLKSPGFERLFASPSLEALFGGAELNVAVCLSRLGEDTAIVTALPDNDVGRACVSEIRRHGVDTSNISLKNGERMGIYFLEAGSNMRPAKVTYDRAGSAMANASAADFDWAAIFSEGRYFHISGVTPALGASASDLALASMKEARKRDFKISFDFNFRSKVWQASGLDPQSHLPGLLAETNYLFASTGDCADHLGLTVDASDDPVATYERVTQQMFEKHENLELMTTTFRKTTSADHQSLWACARDKTGFYMTEVVEMRDIVDRIGAGDAYAAGILFGLENFSGDTDKILSYGLASACLKHTIPGDFNLISREEIEDLLQSEGDVSVRR